MNALNKLEQLTKLAQQEVIPEIDVRNQVLNRINTTAASVDDILFTYALRLWLPLSGVAATAAVIITIFAVQTWMNWSQPLAGLLRNASVIMR